MRNRQLRNRKLRKQVVEEQVDDEELEHPQALRHDRNSVGASCEVARPDLDKDHFVFATATLPKPDGKDAPRGRRNEMNDKLETQKGGGEADVNPALWSTNIWCG